MMSLKKIDFYIQLNDSLYLYKCLEYMLKHRAFLRRKAGKNRWFKCDGVGGMRVIEWSLEPRVENFPLLVRNSIRMFSLSGYTISFSFSPNSLPLSVLHAFLLLSLHPSRSVCSLLSICSFLTPSLFLQISPYFLQNVFFIYYFLQLFLNFQSFLFYTFFPRFCLYLLITHLLHLDNFI